MKTAEQVNELIGQKVMVKVPTNERVDGAYFLVPMEILDGRPNTYGHTRFLVEPVGGSGQAWLNEEKLVLP